MAWVLKHCVTMTTIHAVTIAVPIPETGSNQCPPAGRVALMAEKPPKLVVAPIKAAMMPI